MKGIMAVVEANSISVTPKALTALPILQRTNGKRPAEWHPLISY